MIAVVILAVVYGLGLCAWVALFGTAAQANPQALALAGAVCAVAWPAALIAAVLVRAAQPRR
ncbi:hypothetical protein [Embleya sp. NPDC005971]|uniref:hypothetical protein n=1 Tax=Embleya sp. NPDC005971 TaxID=3156724 RepID=UPI0033DD7052